MMPNDSKPGKDGCWKSIGVWRNSGDPCERLETYTHCHHCPVYAQMAKKVLGRPAPKDRTTVATAELEVTPVVNDGSGVEAFVVKIADVFIAFPHGIINQVMVFSSIHSIPNRHSRAIKGLVNIDGELKICISLGRLLNIEAGNINTKSSSQRAIHERLISIATASGEWILPVSAVIGHQRLALPIPGTTQKLHQPRYIDSILMSDDNPVLLIDAEALDKGLIDAAGGSYG